MLDIGVNINLMPYSLYFLLGLGELQPTIMSIHLAHKSIIYLRDIVNDSLVQVDKLIIL